MVEKIIVMDHTLAGYHRPKPNTLLVRILDGLPRRHFTNIKEWDRYLRVLEYRFDDVDTRFNPEDFVLFNEETAEHMITQVKSLIPRTKTLAVSCYAGQSRSIACAGALNHILDLKIPEEEYFDYSYHKPNMFVYKTLVETAKNKGMKFDAKWLE